MEANDVILFTIYIYIWSRRADITSDVQKGEMDGWLGWMEGQLFERLIWIDKGNGCDVFYTNISPLYGWQT